MTYYEFMGLLLDDWAMLAFSVPVVIGFLFTMVYIPYKNWKGGWRDNE